MMTPGMMDISLAAALTALLAPLLAFFLIMVLLRGRPYLCAGLSIGAVGLSLGSALLLLARHWALRNPLEYSVQWMVSGDLVVGAGVFLDPLSLLMLVVVAVICLLVQIYSLGYMAGDPGLARYYGLMSLFAWAMLSLTLAPNLLQLYVFWELVGLSSYLLIGFWFEKYSATQAGKKAFVMTRLGDVAFLLGILLLLAHLGNLGIREMNTAAVAAAFEPSMLTVAILLIFGGIVGKSAQFPLLTWLPDAMEGPTPVSALLHSATMVAAGVYLFARLFPFFSLSPTAMAVCLAVGTISMLLASTMAMVTRDIKQVWAYSTISQLGFMLMGLASGSYFAGVFHLTTHAGFKALLFLCAGVFIHHFETNDMVAIGRAGGRRQLIPLVCMTLAAAALAGLPPLSGFASKEAVMAALAAHPNPIWLGAGLLGAFLTAYYAFRLIFLIGFPDRVSAGTAAERAGGRGHAHDQPRWLVLVMLVPLVVLALPTLGLGGLQAHLASFLAAGLAGPELALPHLPWLPPTASACALAGLGLAWFEFGRRRASRMGFVERSAFWRTLFAERWYIDRFYRALVDRVIDRGLARLCAGSDRHIIDEAVDGLGRGTVASGKAVSGLHRIMIQHRLGTMFAVIIFLALYFFI